MEFFGYGEWGMGNGEEVTITPLKYNSVGTGFFDNNDKFNFTYAAIA